MESAAQFFCAYCGEPNHIWVDLSGGMQQSYVEDCQVCCRPNQLVVRCDGDTLSLEIESDYAG